VVAVGVGHGLGFPVMLLSGVLGTVGGAPGLLTGLMGWLPGRPTVDAVTHALAATGSMPSVPVHDLAVLAALRLFRWAPRAA
jgi:hypothetical protein